VLASAIPAVASGPPLAKFCPLTWWKALHTKLDKCHFYFETSSSTKHKEKMLGGMVYYIPTVWTLRGDTSPVSPLKCAHGWRRSQGAKPPYKFFRLLGKMCWT